MIEGRRRHLGTYHDEKQAAYKYDEHAVLQGKPVNFPQHPDQEQAVKQVGVRMNYSGRSTPPQSTGMGLKIKADQDEDDEEDDDEDDEGEDEDLETEMILAELIAVHKNERARRGSRTGANCKPVQQISTFGKVIDEFKSGIIAAHALGINSNGISKVCLGYQEHTMGFRFRFKP